MRYVQHHDLVPMVKVENRDLWEVYKMFLQDKVSGRVQAWSNFDIRLAPFSTSRLRFIKFSKPDAIVTPFQEDSRQVTRGEFSTKGSKPYWYVTQYRAIRYFIRAAVEGQGGRLHTSSSICTRALSSGFRTAPLEFSAHLLRGSHRPPFLRSRGAGIYISRNKWPRARQSLRHTGPVAKMQQAHCRSDRTKRIRSLRIGTRQLS